MARKMHAARYAQAVFEIALEHQELDRWQADLEKLAVLMKDAEVRAFLENPRLSPEEKGKLLSKALSGINPRAVNLMLLLVARGKADIIDEIADEYRRRLNRHRGIEEAEVRTAVPIDEDEKEKVARYLESMMGKKIIIKTIVDTDVIGGVVVRAGGKLLDASTRSRLLKLKRELSGAS